ncbi:MAG: hypothetical protein ACLSVD_05010 [Eggerthellaceae bacterium]
MFVFDEPTIGLHPLDAHLLGVFERLVEQGDGRRDRARPDVIANADYVVDLGPGGGPGGRIVAVGTPSKWRQPRERHRKVP